MRIGKLDKEKFDTGTTSNTTFQIYFTTLGVQSPSRKFLN